MEISELFYVGSCLKTYSVSVFLGSQPCVKIFTVWTVE